MTNPERIDLPNGCYWRTDSTTKQGCVLSPNGKFLVSGITLEEAQAFAAAMQPAQPSADAVECAGKLTIIGIDDPRMSEGERDFIIKTNSHHIQQHTDARTNDLRALIQRAVVTIDPEGLSTAELAVLADMRKVVGE